MRRTAAGVVLLVLVCAAVFGRTAGHAMLDWDDRTHVADNPWLAAIDARALAHFWHAPYGNLYIPVAYDVIALEVGATKWLTSESRTTAITPTLLHVVNVALHAANAAMVFLLFLRLVGGTGPALVGALLFALHPLQVESVAWISEVRGLLAAAFGLGAVLALRWATDAHAIVTTFTRIASYVLSLALFTAALLSKPSAVTMPVVAAAVLWVGGVAVGRIARALTPWLALSLAAVVVTERVQVAEVLGTAPLVVWQRLIVSADALVFYSTRLVWPAALAPDYGRTPAYVLERGMPAAALVIAIAALVATLFVSRRSRTVLAGLAIVVGSLLPVLGLLPFHYQAISTVADRYMYMPLAGVSLIAAAGLSHTRSRIVWSVAIAAVSVLGLTSFVQTAHWATNEALWAHNVAVIPHSPVAHNNLGRLFQQAGRTAEADRLLVSALEMDPRSLTVLVNLAELRVAQGRTADAESLYRRAMSAAPNSPRAAVGLGVLVEQTGHHDEARALFERALALDSSNVEAMNNLGALRLRAGDITGGTALLEGVLERDPAHTGALFNLAMVRARAGHAQLAGELWQRAADAGLRGADVRLRAGGAFADAGDVLRAVRAYESAATEDPRAFEPYDQLGLLLMRHGRYVEALAAFERALARAPGAQEPAAHLNEARRLSGR